MIATTSLGRGGPTIGRLGYDAMLLEGFYASVDEDSAVETLRHTIERGMMIDSADACSAGHDDASARPGLARGATLL